MAAPARDPAASRTPGVPYVVDGMLVSTHPATGDEVGRFPVAGPSEVAAALDRARTAAAWWASLGHAGRRERLLRWRALLVHRIHRAAALITAETGKPTAEAVVETAVGIEHIDWAARNARRVLRHRRVRSRLVLVEHSAHLEYLPYGVVGVIGPWNYPVLTPLGSVAYALAAGNAVLLKPSEYTPAVGQWLVDSFTEVVGDVPVLQVVHGLGDTGAALCRSGVDKIAFTGSTATARAVLASCAPTLTPVVLEAGGKDALIVAADADLDAAADACVWGAMTNAGQTCIGIERVYVVDRVFDDFLARVVRRAGRLAVGSGPGADIGPITMPGQVEVIRRHITDAIARGGRAVLGGPGAVRPPYVWPTILVDVPADADAVAEETFGPTLTVTRVADAEQALTLANAVRYGLGGAVFARRGAMDLARRMRSGMTSVNSVLTFVGMASLPFGGIGASGFGRVHGDDGLREFAVAKAVTRRRARALLPTATFARTPADVDRMVKILRIIFGRPR